MWNRSSCLRDTWSLRVAGRRSTPSVFSRSSRRASRCRTSCPGPRQGRGSADADGPRCSMQTGRGSGPPSCLWSSSLSAATGRPLRSRRPAPIPRFAATAARRPTRMATSLASTGSSRADTPVGSVYGLQAPSDEFSEPEPSLAPCPPPRPTALAGPLRALRGHAHDRSRRDDRERRAADDPE